MIDYAATFTNYSGSFPNIEAVNVSAPGAGDGTEFVARSNAGSAPPPARVWSAAAPACEHATALAPSDRMAKAWQESAHEYRLQPPPLNWQPLLKLDSK